MGTAPMLTPPCGASVKVVPIDPKGKNALFEDAQYFYNYASSTMGYPTIPNPASFVVWFWVLNHPQVNRNEVLFHHDGRKDLWADFLTLKQCTLVSVSIIDAWTCVLNARERTRRWGVPTRLFASTFTTPAAKTDCVGLQRAYILIINSLGMLVGPRLTCSTRSFRCDEHKFQAPEV